MTNEGPLTRLGEDMNHPVHDLLDVIDGLEGEGFIDDARRLSCLEGRPGGVPRSAEAWETDSARGGGSMRLVCLDP